MGMQNDEQTVVIGPTADVAAGTGKTWYNRVPGPSGSRWQCVDAYLIPDTAITANGTNYTTFTLTNTTKSLTIASRAYSAVNSVAGTAEELTVTAASRFADGGDTLSWAKAETGTGLAAGCRVVTRWRRIAS